MGQDEKRQKLNAIGNKGLLVWGFIKDIGLAGWTAGLIMAGIAALIARLRDKLPLSVSLLISLFAFALFGFGFHQYMKANRISRFNPAKYKELGQRLTEFSRDTLRSLADWEQRNPRLPQGEHEDPEVYYDRERARDNRLRQFYIEKLLPQANAYIIILHGIKIDAPFNVMSSPHSRPEVMPIYLGTVGQLLEHGLIEEARKLSHSDASKNFAFHLFT